MIAFVTETTADLPDDLCREFGIRVVPTYLVIDGRSYKDGTELSRTEFYKRLPATRPLPTTAAPAAGEFQEAYRSAFADGAEQIVSIHTSSKVSGIFNAARLGAAAAGGKITLIDSLQLSMGIGFQVLAAAEAHRRDKPLEEILQAVHEVRSRVRVFALLDTLEYLKHSGRVSSFRAGVGDILDIKPLIEVANGQVERLGQTRTRRKAVDALVDRVTGLGRLDRLAVMHTNVPEDAGALAARLSPLSASAPIIVEVTPVIGTHVGPGGLGVAVVVSQG